MTETMAETSTWIKACSTNDIPENGGAAVELNGMQIAIFNFTLKDEWYASQNMCPHKMQFVLSRGMIGSHGNDCEPKVACPFHKKTFSLKTGSCLNGDDYTIKTYPIKIEGGNVYISA